MWKSVGRLFKAFSNRPTQNQWDTIFDHVPDDPASVLAYFKTNWGGLTNSEAIARLESNGPNELAKSNRLSGLILLGGNFKNPFIILLILIGVISHLTGDNSAAVMMAIMVGISVATRFIQENRSSKAVENLNSLVQVTATVVRQIESNTINSIESIGQSIGYETREIPFEHLVIGDIVRLSVGDMVPADLVLMSSKDLFISQSVLTGESLPVEKSHDGPRLSLLDTPKFAFLGTNVVSGTAIGVVVATGPSTYLGKISQAVSQKSEPMTHFDKGIRQMTWLFIRFMTICAPLVFFINGYLKHDWKDALLFSIAVAVGLTPEMLPMIVTTNLAKGAVAMSKIKVIVKRLNAIQNLGAMDILCTDKTGTLTQDKIILKSYLDIEGHPSEDVLMYAYLNSHYQTGLKNLLDRAILDHEDTDGLLKILGKIEKIDEIPFDFIRRRMSVVVHKNDGERLLTCKGAIEEVSNICSWVMKSGSQVQLTAELKSQILQYGQSLHESGYRVIAVAMKSVSPTQDQFSVRDESDLSLIGFVAFVDPPKETAASAISALQSHGVTVKILTGDNAAVAAHVCREVGLHVEGIALGQDIDHLSDAELYTLADRTTIFAKLLPLQKARIIQALRHNNHTVGFLGDGINDAPAMRDADVGISVDTASDIARESADIILLEKSLLVLEDGILKGRTVYGNVMKYLKMTASSNFGNGLSIVLSSVFLPFLPMLPTQLLAQNLLYDISQLAIPWDQMDPEFLKTPRHWDSSGLLRFIVWLGPISTIFDFITFGILWWIFGANSLSEQSLFQTGWFVEGLLSQLLVVHFIRTEKIPFFQSIASPFVIQMTLFIGTIGIAIPYSVLQMNLHFTSLPLSYFAWLSGILLGYGITVHGIKRFIIWKTGTWL